jgi:putative zinc finger protein/photosynthesis system II assembly factor YCF48-like protein
VSGPADSDKRFEHVLTSFLREDLGPSRRNCPHPGLLSGYFEGKLAEPEARELEVHLSGCSSCQAELAALVRLQPEPVTEGGRAEPVAAPPTIAVPGEPSPETAMNTAPGEALPFTPKRRRTLWVWVAPVALAASAVLAISVTYRFAPLIEQASRRSREPGVGALEPDNASPRAAKRRDEDTSAKEAPRTARAAPTAAASPAAPSMLDEMRGAESVSPQSESQTRQKTEAGSAAPSGAESQMNGGPTAPAPPAASAPRGEPNAAAEAAPARKDEHPLEPHPPDRAAPLAAVPADQESTAALAKAAKPAADRAVVIALTDPRVAWRLRDASIERSNDAGKTWRAQPSTDATGLLAGSAPSATICWVAGRNGLVLRTTDGEHWKRLAPPTAGDLIDIRARDASNATVRTAVGERFSTRDGGQSWSKL